MPSPRRIAARIAGRTVGDAALAQLARVRGVRALVLNYHIMRAQSMREHLDVLGDLFEILPLEDLLARIDGPAGPRVPAALTFDDGKRSHLTEVAPVLLERGLHASFFVTSQPSATGGIHWFDLAERVRAAFDDLAGGPDGAERVASIVEPFSDLVARAEARPPRLVLDRLKKVDSARRDAVVAELASALGVDPRPIDDDERALTPAEVGELVRLGFTVGSHSATHPILTLESADRVWHEIADSQSQIAEWIGRPVRHFCYPNGNASEATEKATRKAGYTTAWTTVPLWMTERENPHRLPRVQIFEHYDRGEIALKSVLATVGALPNPDGTGRAYRAARGTAPA